MRIDWKGRLARALGVASVVALAACSNILGLHESVDDGECVLNSDCAPDKACIFGVCSPRCQADRDCLAGQRCLRTDDGVACVDSTGAGCNRICPAGTTCDSAQNVCRNGCTSNGDCLGGQVCTNGVCRGSDTGHDPVIDAGARDASVDTSTGGAGGASGSGGNAGTGGASGRGGAAGTGGTSGGTAGSSGSSGAGGNAGSGGASGAGGAAGTGAGGAIGTGGAAGTSGGTAGSGGGVSDAATDTNGDACAHECGLGDTRCGIAQGLQSCVIGTGGCRVWAPEVPCGGRRICTDNTASCTCAPPPAGCENGAGKFCSNSTTLVECAVDADQCVYKLSPVTCPTGKPCTGTHPNASCSCTPPPTSCMNQVGSFCESSSVVATCDLQDGCLAITNRVTCPAGKPCTGSFGAASCSCAAPPTECSAGAGRSCRGPTPGEVVQCGSNSEGCLVVTGITQCPVGKPCAGTPPASDCTCPTPPPGCNQAGTTFCQSSTTVANCGLTDGCLSITGTSSCPMGKPCVNGVCTCPQPPAVCNGAPGTYCGANGNLVTCAIDANTGCLGATGAVACDMGKQCTGTGGNASCTCLPAPNECGGGAGSPGRVCRPGNVLATCAADPTSGCIVVTGTATCPAAKPCAGMFPNADCTCPAPPTGCTDPMMQNGSYCSSGTTVVSCGLNSEGCIAGNMTTCPGGQFCQQPYPSSMCAPPIPIGHYNQFSSSVNHGANTMFGYAVTTTSAVTLVRFGIVVGTITGTKRVRLALYEANANGLPGTLVTGSGLLTLVTGRNEVAPATTNLTLKASTTYFIMALLDTATPVSHDSAMTVTSHYLTMNFTNPFPPTLNDGSSGTMTSTDVSGSNMNYYILVY